MAKQKLNNELFGSIGVESIHNTFWETLAPGVSTVTCFCNPDLVVRMSRRTYKGAKGKRRVPSVGPYEGVLSICRPNYKEREYLKRHSYKTFPFLYSPQFAPDHCRTVEKVLVNA